MTDEYYKINIYEAPGTDPFAPLWYPNVDVSQLEINAGTNKDIFSYTFVTGYLNSIFPLSLSVSQGVQRVSELIASRPGRFVLVGHSQGAMIMSLVYRELVSGNLADRLADCVGVYLFANPMREEGRAFPGAAAITPGGGVSDDRLTDTPDLVWEFSVPNDPISAVDQTTEYGQRLTDIFQALMGNWSGLVSGLRPHLTKGGSDSEIQTILTALSNFKYHPQAGTYSPIEGDPRTSMQIVVDDLNTRVGPAHRFDYPMPPKPTLLDSLTVAEWACERVRDRHNSMRLARPLIRVWMNNPDPSIAGASYVGRIDFDDTIKGSFPFKNNTPSEGMIQLRDDHYISMWLKKLPNDPSLRKNVIITVDFYGGVKRWSGMLDRWEIKSRDGVKYLEATFQDDLAFLQYILCPPNPVLPIPVFQFPRIFALAGPARWTISMIIFINLLRLQTNFYQLPDDPFKWESWDDIWDWSDWQAHIVAPPFLQDSSLWTFISSRMNPVDSIIADSLDDGQLSLTYRRIITDDGEVCSPNPFVSNVKNCALVFEVVDNSNVTALEGSFLQGTIVDGFVRSVIEYGGGFVEDIFTVLKEDQTLAPDEYYQNGFMGTMAKQPWLVLRDNEWSPIESSSLSWGPSKNVSLVVGGDNPAADAIAKLTIETIGNLLGALILFSSIGSIWADVIMPFLVGTIAAWLYWRNTGRANELGWIHYLEAFQQGGDSNAWSLSAVAALRGGFLLSKAESHHVMDLHDSWVLPGVHADIGHRIGSTIDSKGLEDIIWVNQMEEMVAAWDHTVGSQQPYAWKIKVGRSQRALSLGERLARLTKKMSTALSNVGVSIIQG